jgi:transposase-like protein
VGGKHHTIDEIIEKLQTAEKALATGMTAGAICRKLSITEQTYYRWRRVYGGSPVEQAKRIRELERENGRLRKLIAEQALYNGIVRKRGPKDH